jgi:hypothetical protein
MDEALSFEDIVRIGETFYLDELRQKLEPKDMGKYVVIDVDARDYVIDENKLTAIEAAKTKFGAEHLFFITRVGELHRPTMNFKSYAKPSWAF